MILVVDVGTSGIRGIIVNRMGKVVFKEQREYELCIGENGIVEMDLKVLDYHLYAVLTMAAHWVQGENKKISCISVTAQRSSVIPVDQNGRALSKAMMWQDTRAAGICEELSAEYGYIYKICGMRPSPVFSAPKMKYLKQNKPEIYEQAYKLIGFQEYVIYSLSGEFTTDFSLASRTGLFDIKKLNWSDELLEMYGIEKEKLCRLIQPGSRAGDTGKEVTKLLGLNSAVPVISAGGDQQCAALGMGCTEPGDLIANSGTGSFVIAVCDKPVFDPQMRVSCNAFVIPGKWMIEGAVLSAGKAVDWMTKLFFAENHGGEAIEVFSKVCEDSPPGARGLMMIPVLAGIGTPLWNPKARGMVLGLGLEHEKSDFAKALLEGIAAEMKECIDIIACLTDMPYDTVRIAGGMNRIPIYNQIQADMYCRTVVKPADDGATGLGGFLSAAVWLGWYQTFKEAYEAVVAGRDEKRYKPMKETAAVYDEVYKNLKAFERKIYSES